MLLAIELGLEVMQELIKRWNKECGEVEAHNNLIPSHPLSLSSKVVLDILSLLGLLCYTLFFMLRWRNGRRVGLKIR